MTRTDPGVVGVRIRLLDRHLRSAAQASSYQLLKEFFARVRKSSLFSDRSRARTEPAAESSLGCLGLFHESGDHAVPPSTRIPGLVSAELRVLLPSAYLLPSGGPCDGLGKVAGSAIADAHALL